MCRIFGYLSQNNIIDDLILENVKNVQLDGGPDEQEILRINDFVALGHNRLSLQDIDNGHQPFQRNNIFAVFNGEIYNHVELREMLGEYGYEFSSYSDGEAIIALYIEYGLDFAKYLNGMFAIALYDGNNKSLVLCTDHCAMKSVYYAYDNNTFYFSSDINGIHEFFGKAKKPYLEHAIDDYLVGRCIWGDQTFFEHIHVMSPASMIVIDTSGHIQYLKYQSAIKYQYKPAVFNDCAANLHALLESEINSMILSDVKPCAVVSGGLDSSYVATIMAKLIGKIDIFHVCYEVEHKKDERHFAQLLANKIGAKYNEVLIKNADLQDLLYKMVDSMGVPNTAPHALSAFYLYQNIKQSGYKIAFAGEGADEVFCGYRRFSDAIFNHDDNWVDKYFCSFSIACLSDIRSYYNVEYANYIKTCESTYDKLSGRWLNDLNLPENRIEALLNIEHNLRFPNYILRRTDHLSMANSLEIRLPFCQPKVIDFAKSLPLVFKLDRAWQKKILFQAAANIVPNEILSRDKQPFIMPVLEMLLQNDNLKHMMIDVATNNYHIKKYFNTNKLINDINSTIYDSKRADVIWAILILGIWMEKNV